MQTNCKQCLLDHEARLNHVLSGHAKLTDDKVILAEKITTLGKEVEKLRDMLRGTLEAFCERECSFDMNYGGVKYHSVECSEIRRLLGQKVDDKGRIPDEDLGKLP